jgi:ABC-2 type transport system permease protein
MRKEFLHLRHDRKMIPVLFVGPVLQLLALGFAANSDVRDIPFLLLDQDRSAASRNLVDRFTGSGYFDLVGSVEGGEEIEPWLVDGRAQVALVIADGYGRAAASGRRASVQVIADGSDAASAVVGLGYASRIMAGENAELAARALGRSPSSLRRVELVPRVWYNPDLRSRWFYVPAILAMVLMLTTMIVPSMAVVREREIGTLEQLIVTPVRPWQLILGKLVPFAIIGFLDMLLVTALVVHLFGVPLRGSIFMLAALTLPFLMTTLGLGLLASTLVVNQQQAMMTSIFLIMVPMIYLSGLIFPIENMPRPIQVATYAIPLRYYNNIIRGIFLKGSGLGVLWPDALALLAFGAGALTLASFRFQKRLD